MGMVPPQWRSCWLTREIWHYRQINPRLVPLPWTLIIKTNEGNEGQKTFKVKKSSKGSPAVNWRANWQKAIGIKHQTGSLPLTRQRTSINFISTKGICYFNKGLYAPQVISIIVLFRTGFFSLIGLQQIHVTYKRIIHLGLSPHLPLCLQVWSSGYTPVLYFSPHVISFILAGLCVNLALQTVNCVQ